MHKLHIGPVLVLLASLTALTYAADLNGQWKSQEGDNPSFTFNLKSDGQVLTGTMLGQDGKERPISNGKLEGTGISFSVMSEWQGNPIKLVAKGSIKDDQISLNIGTEDGAWSTDTTLKRAGQTGK